MHDKGMHLKALEFIFLRPEVPSLQAAQKGDGLCIYTKLSGAPSLSRSVLKPCLNCITAKVTFSNNFVPA